MLAHSVGVIDAGEQEEKRRRDKKDRRAGVCVSVCCARDEMSMSSHAADVSEGREQRFSQSNLLEVLVGNSTTPHHGSPAYIT